MLLQNRSSTRTMIPPTCHAHLQVPCMTTASPQRNYKNGEIKYSARSSRLQSQPGFCLTTVRTGGIHQAVHPMASIYSLDFLPPDQQIVYHDSRSHSHTLTTVLPVTTLHRLQNSLCPTTSSNQKERMVARDLGLIKLISRASLFNLFLKELNSHGPIHLEAI